MVLDEYCNWVLVILLSIISVYYIYDKSKNRKKSFASIPGPKPTDPKFGNLLDIKKSGSIHQYLDTVHRNYGDIVSFYWYDKRIVSICSHELFKCVQKLFDRPVLLFENFAKFIGENSLQLCNGEEAVHRRKEYDKAFQHDAIIQYIKTIEQIGKESLENLKLKESPINSIEHFCLSMSVQGILKACLAPSGKSHEFYDKIINLYTVVFDSLEIRFVKGEKFSENDETEIQFQKYKSEFYSIVKDLINERITLIENNNIDDKKLLLIDHIILYHRDIDKDLIENEVMIYMIGGFHSSGCLLAWCIYYLSKHPECQEKLYKEISKTPLEFSCNLECYKKISDMKYLRACINETLRLGQIATYGGRISSEDICLKSYNIPANTPIVLAYGVSFKDENVFFSNEKFIPERFIHSNFPSFAFTPFGFAGKRQCPGERFTYLELSIWLYQLVGMFSFSLTDPDQMIDKSFGIVTRMGQKVSINYTER